MNGERDPRYVGAVPILDGELMDFVVIAPANLRLQWDRISASLDAVLAKASGEDWIKEDVYHAIKSGQAACHFAVGETGFAGLLITTLTRAEFSGS